MKKKFAILSILCCCALAAISQEDTAWNNKVKDLCCSSAFRFAIKNDSKDQKIVVSLGTRDFICAISPGQRSPFAVAATLEEVIWSIVTEDQITKGALSYYDSFLRRGKPLGKARPVMVIHAVPLKDGQGWEFKYDANEKLVL